MNTGNPCYCPYFIKSFSTGAGSRPVGKTGIVCVRTSLVAELQMQDRCMNRNNGDFFPQCRLTTGRVRGQGAMKPNNSYS